MDKGSSYLRSSKIFLNEVNKKSSIKEDTRKMENWKSDNIPEKRFLQKLLEIRVIDHYARNIYIKVSLKVAVPWVLLTSKILLENISKFVRKYIQYVRCWSLARNLFHPQFHFLEFFLYIRNTSFQEHLRVFRIHFFYWNVSSKNLFSLFLCFFKKSDVLYLFPTNWLLLIINSP